jgi:hypothetical protein
MSKMLERIEELWCIHMHTATMWPFKGHYQCGVCLRQFPVSFEAAQMPERMPAVAFAQAHVAARRA